MSELLPWWLPWLLLLLALLGWWWATGRVGRANRQRQRVASAGEATAEDLLAEAGFEVLDRQVTARWALLVDDEPVEVTCRADLVVEREGERFVAEVKTGAVAPDPARPATRRQLLEYALVFDVTGVLLVDVPEGRIRRVAFPGVARDR
ncbi:MAG: PD-(D/E)XK nuclease family protein [Alphaproteobacteria bacterium]|nr:PD-(D/E)XK nuclease family protein [Alphaproteobacteria bacterium]